METISFGRAQAAFGRLLRRVVRDRRPVAIARRGSDAVVLVPLRDWAAMTETLHLLSTGSNAARLRAAIDELDAPD